MPEFPAKSPEFHQRVRDIFEQALDQPEATREEFVRAASSGDTEILASVQGLLEAHREAASFLGEEPPAIERVGRYEVQEEVGRGGMGVVFKATDSLIGRSIALKVIRLSAAGTDADMLRKHLLAEARSAGSLSHPGIVIIFDAGFEGDLAYIAMELVEGPTLQQGLCAERFPEHGRVLDILRQSAAALDYAHGKGIIHRDIKPGNIMLHRGTVVKIADFGIAKVTATVHQTQTGPLMGTPSYMAPEQMKGHRATGRSDQFSLAVVAFEMLAGAKPFTGESLATLVLKVVYESRPSLRALNAQLPAAVDDVLRKALAQDGGDRYGSCGEFVMALEAALKTPVTAAVPFSSAGEPRERRHLVWGGAAAALLLAGATAYHMLRPTPPPPQLPEVKKTVTAPPLPVPTPVPRPKTVPPETPKPAPPKVVEFRAVPPALMRGERFMLNWNVTGASTVSISPGVGAVAPAGSQSLLASATSTYTLTATGQGGTTRAFASVAVSERLVLPAPLTGRTTMSGEALEPFLIRRGQPVYPAAARAAGVQGSVRFFATIGKDGKVTHLQALSGPPELLEAGADAAMQYRYRPVQRNGQPIEVDTEIFVVFRLPGR